MNLCLSSWSPDTRNHVPEQDRAWTCHASTCVFLGPAAHVRTLGHDAVAGGFGRGRVWGVGVFGRKEDEETNLGVRSWFGDTLGRSFHLNNGKQRQICVLKYIYLRNTKKQR